MTETNVEIVRRATEAFNRRDFEAWLGYLDPEVVWYALPDEPEPGPFRGHEAIGVMAARWTEFLPDLRVAIHEYIPAGEYVLAPARMSGHTPDSDADVTVDEVYVDRLRDGKIIEVREFRTREEAFAAVDAASVAEQG